MQQAEIMQNHENATARNIRKCEARHRKYMRLGGGQAYDRSRDQTAVVTRATC
jgi:hypothetical protein